MILRGCVVPALLLLGLLMIEPSVLNFARGDVLNAGVFSTDTKPYGLSYGDWTAKWWQWLLSIPKNSSPASDTTGINCGLKQSGPVFYLAGMQGGVAKRVCSIPVGKAILFPVLNGECTLADSPTAKTDSDLYSCARATNAGPVTLTASIDGRNLQQLDKYRVTSAPVNVTMVDNNIAGAKAGPTRGVFDGWWVFLNPLSAGSHDIHFASSIGNPTVVSTSPPFSMDVTYHLNVK